ncbi:hypothetical protein N8728_03045 [Candidatus Pelagibacter sp.]|nr:hypothetical protein [Candidatus Pelagibacter sp.]
MLKKTTLLLLLCFLWSCGYEPLYLEKNNLKQTIKVININGDQKINKFILSSLGIKEDRSSTTGYILTLKSSKKIDIISKDKTGNPSIYKTSIMVNFSLTNEETIVKQKEFSSSFTYNNSQSKFDLFQYQKNIELNLINEISEKIFIYLRT